MRVFSIFSSNFDPHSAIDICLLIMDLASQPSLPAVFIHSLLLKIMSFFVEIKLRVVVLLLFFKRTLKFSILL